MSGSKPNLTLDFNQVKKNCLSNVVLSSPDLKMLKVDTPELESILLASDLPNTPTPSLAFEPAAPVTAEQERFAGVFEQVLNSLHKQGSDSNASTTSSTVYNDTFLPQIKEEPQSGPTIVGPASPSSISPVDMDDQERLKLERKRQRNRLAASKCRSRKLERISKLEEKVKLLKSENADLASLVNQLKESVGLLKYEVIEHNKAGCQMNFY